MKKKRHLLKQIPPYIAKAYIHTYVMCVSVQQTNRRYVMHKYLPVNFCFACSLCSALLIVSLYIVMVILFVLTHRAFDSSVERRTLAFVIIIIVALNVHYERQRQREGARVIPLSNVNKLCSEQNITDKPSNKHIHHALFAYEMNALQKTEKSEMKWKKWEK